jgi:hypothetical protein
MKPLSRRVARLEKQLTSTTEPAEFDWSRITAEQRAWVKDLTARLSQNDDGKPDYSRATVPELQTLELLLTRCDPTSPAAAHSVGCSCYYCDPPWWQQWAIELGVDMPK